MNVGNIIGGNGNLSAAGEKYGIRLGQHIKELNIDTATTKFITSKLNRTLQTAKLAGIVNATADGNLDEINAGDYDGFTFDYVKGNNTVRGGACVCYGKNNTYRLYDLTALGHAMSQIVFNLEKHTVKFEKLQTFYLSALFFVYPLIIFKFRKPSSRIWKPQKWQAWISLPQRGELRWPMQTDWQHGGHVRLSRSRPLFGHSSSGGAMHSRHATQDAQRKDPPHRSAPSHGHTHRRKRDHLSQITLTTPKNNNTKKTNLFVKS